MKRLTLLFIMAFVFKFSFAQWTTGTDIYNTNAGNVGIGTTSPSKKLDITSPGGTLLSLGNGSLSGAGSRWDVNVTSDYKLLFGRSGIANDFAITSNGNVGVGTTNPGAILHVVNGYANMQFAAGGGAGLGEILRMWGPNGMVFSANSFVPSSGNLITDLGINYSIDGADGVGRYARIGSKKAPVIRLNAEDGSITLFGDNGTGSDFRTPAFNLGVFVKGDGSVGIGTDNPQGYKLAVNGDAIFTKVKVKLYANWPDYVFHPPYKLPSLKEVEEFIKQNNHLPDIPSASEVEKNGLDLGDNQALLLKKIEELTLYMIELKKEVDAVKKENEKLKKKLSNPNQ